MPSALLPHCGSTGKWESNIKKSVSEKNISWMGESRWDVWREGQERRKKNYRRADHASTTAGLRLWRFWRLKMAQFFKRWRRCAHMQRPLLFFFEHRCCLVFFSLLLKQPKSNANRRRKWPECVPTEPIHFSSRLPHLPFAGKDTHQRSSRKKNGKWKGHAVLKSTRTREHVPALSLLRRAPNKGSLPSKAPCPRLSLDKFKFRNWNVEEPHTLRGSLSAVSRSIFARKHKETLILQNVQFSDIYKLCTLFLHSKLNVSRKVHRI